MEAFQFNGNFSNQYFVFAERQFIVWSKAEFSLHFPLTIWKIPVSVCRINIFYGFSSFKKNILPWSCWEAVKWHCDDRNCPLGHRLKNADMFILELNVIVMIVIPKKMKILSPFLAISISPALGVIHSVCLRSRRSNELGSVWRYYNAILIYVCTISFETTFYQRTNWTWNEYYVPLIYTYLY